MFKYISILGLLLVLLSYPVTPISEQGKQFTSPTIVLPTFVTTPQVTVLVTNTIPVSNTQSVCTQFSCGITKTATTSILPIKGNVISNQYMPYVNRT